MDDDRKKPPRKPVAKGAMARPRHPGPRKQGEKLPFVGKPHAAGTAKPASKPFKPKTDRVRPRGDDASPSAGTRADAPERSAASGDRADRPAKTFRPRPGKPSQAPRADRSGPARGERPFRAPRSADSRGSDGGEDKRPRPPRSPASGEPGFAKPHSDRPFRAPVRSDERGPRSADAPREFRRGPRPDGGGAAGPRPGPDAPTGFAIAVPGERIAKRLARVGIASRRDAEELIAAGRIKVNGKILTSPAFNVTPEDTIELDGTLLPPVERTRVFLFNKPAGVVTTNRDPQGRKTVFDVLPQELPRLITVGRLDINTEGLLLLTNDGGLARVLELPATGWMRRYRARVHGKVDEKQLAGLKDGMAVDGVFYGAIEASLDREQGSNAWLTIGLREGKNREVKNILGALGLEVTRLIRISFGPFQLGELPDGHVVELKGRLLRDQLGERLIEESSANFEADIQKPFSNEPRRRAPEPRPAPLAARPLRDQKPVRIGEGGLIKKRQFRENVRDDALGKLSTRPERAPRPEREDRPDRDGPRKPFQAGKPMRGKKNEREQRPIDPPGGRKANVWMAPGARPIGTGRAAAEKAEVDARKASRKAPYGKPGFGSKSPGGRSSGPGEGGRPRGKPGGKGPGGDRRS